MGRCISLKILVWRVKNILNNVYILARVPRNRERRVLGGVNDISRRYIKVVSPAKWLDGGIL